MDSSADSPHAAYRVRSERLLLRVWQPSDVFNLLASLERNRDHLAQWLDWAAQEPVSVDEKVGFVLRQRAKFDTGEDFVYGLFDPETDSIVGGAGLHTRCGPGGLEIGYWIDEECGGQGLASEASAALARIAFDVHHVQRVEIRVDPENLASARIAEKLGFVREGVLQRRLEKEGRWGDLLSFSLAVEDFPASPAAAYFVEAFDAIGRPLF